MNLHRIHRYLPHLLRKKFKKKIIIIESDDWGMERLIYEDSINWMKHKFGEKSFTRWSYDSLETSQDLNLLFDLLDGFKSKFDKPPVITANFVTHNIDYSSKDALMYRSLRDGFNAGSEDVRDLYRKGIEKNYIYPQLHGYSHYNVSRLKEYFETMEGKEAHENKFIAARSTVRKNLSFLQGEFSLDNAEVAKIKTAANEFKNFFGFYSNTIIPPTFIFDRSYSALLLESNITMVQSSNRLISDNKTKLSFPYFRKVSGLYWSVRNCRLDPNPEYGFYSDKCLKSIRDAFEYSYPAIIDFHRVNFSGKFRPETRDKTLAELKSVLDGIHKHWPSAIFMNSSEFAATLWRP